MDKEITIQPLSTSVSDGKFSAHGYVTYQGKSPNAMEFEFRYIDAFEWSSSPNYQYTDKIAHAWQAHTTSISSYARTIQTLPGATNDNYLSVTSEGAYASSAEIQFVSQVFNNLKGYLVDNVRIPISNSGTTGKYVGAYAHPWSMLEPSISVGPISVGYGGFIGDEWSWETTYTISSSL
ncbi:hypothetical protein D3C73_1082000 [compost metagenome]